MIEDLKKQAEAFLTNSQLADAETVWQQICSLEPDSAVNRVNLGKTRHRLGKLADAEASYREATGLDPTCIEAYYFLANALREAGKLEEAASTYEQVLRLQPDHLACLNNLGILLTHLGDNESAAKHLEHALKLQPDSVMILTNLGDVCVALSRHKEAIDHLEKALQINPGFANAQRALANAQHHAGMMQEALSSYAALARLQPDSLAATLGSAKILEQLERHDEAYALLQPLLDTTDCDDAVHTFFNISKHLGKREEAIERLTKILGRKNIRDEAAADVHFKLGKHFDESGQYETAFQHYQQANELSPKEFNMGKLARFVADNISVYNREFTGQMPVAGNHSELPVFVLGMPRTGTSLVEQILASHPDVAGGGELPLVQEIVQRLAADFPGYVYPLYAPRLSQQSLDTTAVSHLQALQALGGAATRVTDKLPHNFRNIGMIAQLFPAARIIHCTKHPLDTCLSCYFAQFSTEAHGYSYSLETVGEYYLQYRRLMTHWQNVFPEKILTVPYRQLVLDQEKTSRKIVEFCGLDWDDRCLDFHNTDRLVFTLSYDQVRQPLYTGSLDRWKHYEQQLRSLRALLESNSVKCE